MIRVELISRSALEWRAMQGYSDHHPTCTKAVDGDCITEAFPYNLLWKLETFFFSKRTRSYLFDMIVPIEWVLANIYFQCL